MYRFFLLNVLLFMCLTVESTTWNGQFDSADCPTTVCDDGNECTEVVQCKYVDSSALHCSVNNEGSQISCHDIQSRSLLTPEGQCQSLGNGSIETPWCSVQQAAQQSSPGDLVLLAPGRYLVPEGTNGLHEFNTAAVEEKPITFRNAAFDPDFSKIPVEEVILTPYTEVSGWNTLDSGNDYLICHHAGIDGDDTTFNGIATNVRATNDRKPFLRLFNEECGVANSNDALTQLKNLSSLTSIRENKQGHFVQIWQNGSTGGSTCPTYPSAQGEIAVRVNKTESIQSCQDLTLDVTGVGHTVRLKSSGDICGDLEEILALKESSESHPNYSDNEADHLRFEGLTIEGAKYGFTIETDYIDIRYSRIEGSHKDAIKAIGNEPWDHRFPNQCGRVDDNADSSVMSPALSDLVNYCLGQSQSLMVGELIAPPSCNNGLLDVASLDPDYFYWDLPEAEARAEMVAARDSTEDGHCVDSECVYQSAYSLRTYCSWIEPTFALEPDGITASLIPDNCNDFYYFNSQYVSIENSDIRYYGEDGIDITGGDYWNIVENTIHDAIITHGSGQLPSGVLTKNASNYNKIESNLLFNIHHSVTGILTLGGSPEKKGSATHIVAENNVLLSVSGNEIIHIPNCEHCTVAHNLLMDLVIGEIGSRSRGLIHVGGNRRNCMTSTGYKLNCGGEKRSAEYEGTGNSVVNNLIELLKWRDADSYRVLSFGGFNESVETAYSYNGDNQLCVAGNHINGGSGIIGVTSHVNENDVPDLACPLSNTSENASVTFSNERVGACVALLDSGFTTEQLTDCLQDSSNLVNGDPIELISPNIFDSLGLNAADSITQPIGVCSSTTTLCSVDSQCGQGVCEVNIADPLRCALGPRQTATEDLDCDVNLY